MATGTDLVGEKNSLWQIHFIWMKINLNFYNYCKTPQDTHAAKNMKREISVSAYDTQLNRLLIILWNSSLCKKSRRFEVGISDHHQLVLKSTRSHYTEVNPMIKCYPSMCTLYSLEQMTRSWPFWLQQGDNIPSSFFISIMSLIHGIGHFFWLKV